MESQIRRLAAAAESLEIQARELRAEIRELADSLAAQAERPAAAKPSASAERPEAPAAPIGQTEAAVSPERSGGGAEGARLVALSMALDGKPREETAQHLRETFGLESVDELLDDVYSRVAR